MQLLGLRFKPHAKRLIAFLAIFALLCALLGVVQPGTAIAKTETSEPATSLTVTLNDGNGKIIDLGTYSIAELKKMPQVEREYSSIDSMPAPVFTAGKGVDLIALLEDLDVDINSIERFKFFATDDVQKALTKKYLLDTPRFYYPNIVKCWDEYWDEEKCIYKNLEEVEKDKKQVKPMLAITSSQGRFLDKPDWNNLEGSTCLRLCLGQSEPGECSTMNFIRWVYQVEVTGKLQEKSGTVKLTSPAAGQTYSPGDTVTISGTARNLDAVTVEVADPGGQAVYSASSLDTKSGSFATKFTLDKNARYGDYTVKISGKGLAKAYTATFRVMKPGTGVTIITPITGQTYKPGDAVTISGTVQNLTTISIKVADSVGKVVYSIEDLDTSSGSFSVEFTLGNDAAGDYTVRISGVGLANDSTVTFKVSKGSSGGGKKTDGDSFTITGVGLSSPVQFTRDDLEGMRDQLVDRTYSTVNRVPKNKLIKVKGIPLSHLLTKAGVNLSAVRKINVIGSDGYDIAFTKEELLDTKRYVFPKILSDSASGAEEVPTILAYESSEAGSDFMLALGQRALTEQNNYQWVKGVTTIKLSSENPGRWSKVTAEPPGGVVDENTEIFLNHQDVPWKVKIYYTTDGSTPTLDSPIYNYYFGVDENDPLKITEDTTIKAIAVGAGKFDSDVATFEYTFGKSKSSQTWTVKPNEGGTVSLGSDVVVQIPAGAFTDNDQVEVKIERVAVPPELPAGFRLASDVFEFTAGDKSEYSFAKDLTLKLKFNAAQREEGEVAAVHYYDETAKRWVNIGGTVAGDLITVQVDHFTKFAVIFVKQDEVEPGEQPEIKPEEQLILTDIADHWAETSIKKLVALGAIKGCPDGTFKPDDTITRAEFSTVLVKAFELVPQNGKVFADTAGHWAQEYITTAAAHGIVGGYDDTTFGPDDPITREQMAVLIVKAARLVPAAGEVQFADSGIISSWAKDAVATAVKNGVIKGRPDNTFGPKANATRAEAVTVVVNALLLLSEGSTIE